MEKFFEGLYKHHMFKGLTPDGEEVSGALVPHGSLSLNVASGLPPVVMWHMIELATINGEPQNTDVMVDLETVGISLGWTNEQGRPVYVPLKELADAWKELVAYRATKLTPDDLNATFNDETFLRLAARVLDTTPERLQELAQADHAGRLVVLPVEPWFGPTRQNEMYIRENGEVWAIYVTGCEAGPNADGVFTVMYTTVDGDVFSADDIGKTVFLTRQEAEAAEGKEVSDDA